MPLAMGSNADAIFKNLKISWKKLEFTQHSYKYMV